MIRDLRVLLAYRRRTVRATLRERGWAQRAVIVLFLTVGAVVFFGSFFIFSQVFTSILGQAYGEAVIARYVLESALYVVFLLGVASFLAVSFNALFSADEIRYLSTLPISPQTLFAYRLCTAGALASWPILLVGIPAVVALGNAVGAGVAYYVAAFLTLGLFLDTIVVVGALLAFAIIPLIRHLRRPTRFLVQIVAFVGFLMLLVRTAIPRGIFGAFFHVTSPAEASARIERIREWFAFSPSRPFADLLGAVLPFGPAVQIGSLFLGLVVVVISLTVILFAIVRNRYIRTVQQYGETGFLARSDDIGPVHPRHAFPAIFRWRHGYLFEKDLLSFFRDQGEVSRAAFLATLLLLYVLSARSVTLLDAFNDPARLAMAVTFSFGAIGYFAMAFALRFVYPSLSLEGRSAWVLWTSPIHIHEFFSWKLFFWSTLTLVGTVSAALLTVLLFGMPVLLGLFFVFAVMNVTLGLVAIALGQGSIFPDFDEPDPDVLTTSPSGIATTIVAGAYLFMVGRYVYGYAYDFLVAGTTGLLDGFGILILTLSVMVLYWVLAPRSMDVREIA